MAKRNCGRNIVSYGKAAKKLIIGGKLNIWNEVVEKVNSEFEEGILERYLLFTN